MIEEALEPSHTSEVNSKMEVIETSGNSPNHEIKEPPADRDQ